MDSSDNIQQSNIPESNSIHQSPVKKKVIRKPYDKKKHGKRYPLTQKIAIKAMKTLHDEGKMTVTDIAKSAQTTRQEVYRVWEDKELDALSPQVVDKTKKGLTGIFYKRALEATLNMKQEKFDQASLLQLATVAGIMTEKGRLMEGLSTENVSHRGVIQNIDNDRQKLMSRLENLEKSETIDNQAD